MSMIAGGIGAGLTTIAGIVQGVMRAKGAKQQAAKASDLRSQSKFVPKEQLRPEFQRVRDAQTIAATTGLSGRDIAESKIDQSVSNMAKDAATIGSSGGASLAALSGSYGKGMESKQDLMIRDAQERDRKAQILYGTEMTIGEKQRDLELERQRKVEMILAEASALDKAAMANKMGAYDVAANAVMQGAGMLASSVPQQGATSPRASQSQQSPMQYREAPMQYQYITPGYYSNNTQADTAPIQGGKQIELPKNQGSSNMWNWGK